MSTPLRYRTSRKRCAVPSTRYQLTLVRRPFNQAFVPFIPTHTVGAGAIVIHDAGELLVVRARGTTGFKLPGGHVDAAKRIQDSIEREVLEETGIESKCKSIVAFTTGQATTVLTVPPPSQPR